MDAAFGWEPPADTSITSDPARNSGLPSAATRPSGWVVDFGPVRGCSRESREPSGAIGYPSKKFVLLGAGGEYCSCGNPPDCCTRPAPDQKQRGCTSRWKVS